MEPAPIYLGHPTFGPLPPFVWQTPQLVLWSKVRQSKGVLREESLLFDLEGHERPLCLVTFESRTRDMREIHNGEKNILGRGSREGRGPVETHDMMDRSIKIQLMVVDVVGGGEVMPCILMRFVGGLNVWWGRKTGVNVALVWGIKLNA